VFNFDADDLLKLDSAAQFATTSADGRRHYRQTEDIAPPVHPSGSSSEFNHVENNFDPESLIPGFVNLLEKEVSAENATKPWARRYVSSVGIRLMFRTGFNLFLTYLQDEPLKQWVTY